MKILIYCIGFILFNSTFSQGNKQKLNTISRLTLRSCDLSPFVVDDGTLGIKYLGKEGVKDYFIRRIDPQFLGSLKGEVLIQALIDKKGKICCKEISSPSDISVSKLKELKLDTLINKMDRWQPAKIEGKKWNCSILFSLLFNGNGSLNVLLKRMSAL
jgi:hypothetical protein